MTASSIILTFKVYSETDTYYAAGSSRQGSFTKKLGRGSELIKGDPPYYRLKTNHTVTITQVQWDALTSGQDLYESIELESQGILVRCPVSLEGKYGAFKIRVYAENDLGLRSNFVEVGHQILSSDIQGTYMFGEIEVDGGKIISKEIPSSSEADNVVKTTIDLPSKNFKLGWTLIAPPGHPREGEHIKSLSKGADDGFFKGFEVEVFRSGSSDWEKITDDAIIKEAFGLDPNNTSSFLLQASGANFDKLVVGASNKRTLKIRVTSRVAPQQLSEGGADRLSHAEIILVSSAPEIKSYSAELNGANFIFSYEMGPKNFSEIKLRQYRLNESASTWENVRSSTFPNRGSFGSINIDQKWSNGKDGDSLKNEYRYVVELYDSFGLAASLVPMENGTMGSDITDSSARSFEAITKIGNLKVSEVGSSFNISWNIVDSSGRPVELGSSNPDASQIIKSVAGYFSLPDDVNGTADNIVDAFYSAGEGRFRDTTIGDIGELSRSEDSNNTIVNITKEENAKIYKHLSGNEIANRKLKFTLLLLDGNGDVVDERSETGENAEPSINSDMIFYNDKPVGDVRIHLELSEIIQKIKVYRRPHAKVQSDPKWEYVQKDLTGELQGNSAEAPIASMYNDSVPEFFGEDASASTTSLGQEYFIGEWPGALGGIGKNESENLRAVIEDRDLPLLQKLGDTQLATRYDYYLVPYDEFGAGAGTMVEEVDVLAWEFFAADEDGVRQVDDNPPGGVGNFDVTGAFETFFLSWDAPSDNDIDRYRVTAIIDKRSDRTLFDLETVGGALKLDDDLDNEAWKKWTVATASGSNKDTNTYKQRKSASGELHGMVVKSDGSSLKSTYATPLGGYSDSDDGANFFKILQGEDTVDGEILISGSQVHRKTDTGSEQIESVEYKVFETSQTQLQVSGGSGQVGYFYIETIDRSGNYSKVVGGDTNDPKLPDPKKLTLGEIAGTTLEDFEEKMTENFPGAVISNGAGGGSGGSGHNFSIVGNILKWGNTTLWKNGESYFIAGGEIDLFGNTYFTPINAENPHVGSPIKYVYWDPIGGYDPGDSANSTGTFKPREKRPEGAPTDYVGYYSFSIYNPASASYSLPDGWNSSLAAITDYRLIGNHAATLTHSAWADLATDEARALYEPAYYNFNDVFISGSSEAEAKFNLNLLLSSSAISTGGGLHIPYESPAEGKHGRAVIIPDNGVEIVKIDRIGAGWAIRAAWHAFANAVIGSAHIGEAAILDAHINTLTADKITSGEVNSSTISLGEGDGGIGQITGGTNPDNVGFRLKGDGEFIFKTGDATLKLEDGQLIIQGATIKASSGAPAASVNISSSSNFVELSNAGTGADKSVISPSDGTSTYQVNVSNAYWDGTSSGMGDETVSVQILNDSGEDITSLLGLLNLSLDSDLDVNEGFEFSLHWKDGDGNRFNGGGNPVTVAEQITVKVKIRHPKSAGGNSYQLKADPTNQITNTVWLALTEGQSDYEQIPEQWETITEDEFKVRSYIERIDGADGADGADGDHGAPGDSAFRLSLTKPFISYDPNNNSDRSNIQHPSNIVPLTVALGASQKAGDFGAGSDDDLVLTPSFGLVTNGATLLKAFNNTVTGSDNDYIFGGGYTALEAATDNLKPLIGPEVDVTAHYDIYRDDAGDYKICLPGEHKGIGDSNSEFLFFIPGDAAGQDAASLEGNSSVSIKATLNEGGKTYTDHESFQVVADVNVPGDVFWSRTNDDNVVFPSNQDGNFDPINNSRHEAELEVYRGTTRVSRAPDEMILSGGKILIPDHPQAERLGQPVYVNTYGSGGTGSFRTRYFPSPGYIQELLDYTQGATNILQTNWSPAASGFNIYEYFNFSHNITGNYGGKNGDANVIETQLLPDGSSGPVWVSRGNDSANDAEGGWNILFDSDGSEAISAEKTYMSVLYVKVEEHGDNLYTGQFYHGTSYYNMVKQINNAGSGGTNPYFSYFPTRHFPEGVWCVSIGFIRPFSETYGSNPTWGGVYRLDTGEKLPVTGVHGIDYQWDNQNTSGVSAWNYPNRVLQHRAFLFYDTNPPSGSVEMHFANPGLFEIPNQTTSTWTPDSSQLQQWTGDIDYIDGKTESNVSAITISSPSFPAPVKLSGNRCLIAIDANDKVVGYGELSPSSGVGKFSETDFYIDNGVSTNLKKDNSGAEINANHKDFSFSRLGPVDNLILQFKDEQQLIYGDYGTGDDKSPTGYVDYNLKIFDNKLAAVHDLSHRRAVSSLTQGTVGEDGQDGVSFAFKGVWSWKTTYTNGSVDNTTRDVVALPGGVVYPVGKPLEGAPIYVIAKKDIPAALLDTNGIGFTGKTRPMYSDDGLVDNDYWEEFIGQFESMATGLLLSQDIMVGRGVVTGINEGQPSFIASQLNSKYYNISAVDNSDGDEVKGYNEKRVSESFSFTDNGNNINLDYATSDNPLQEYLHDQYPNTSGHEWFADQTDWDYYVTAGSLESSADDSNLGYDVYGKNHWTSALGASDRDDRQEYIRKVTTAKDAFADALGNIRNKFNRPYKTPDDGSPGYFLGYIDNEPKLELYKSTNSFLKWDGTNLRIKGAIIDASVDDTSFTAVKESNSALVLAPTGDYGGQVFVGGGFNNKLKNNYGNLASCILGGGNNSIASLTGDSATYYGEETSRFSLIGGGYGNSLVGNFSCIGGGYFNKIKEANISSILGGARNSLFGSSYSLIASGFDNLIEDSKYSSIVNGQSNTISVDGADLIGTSIFQLPDSSEDYSDIGWLANGPDEPMRWGRRTFANDFENAINDSQLDDFFEVFMGRLPTVTERVYWKQNSLKVKEFLAKIIEHEDFCRSFTSTLFVYAGQSHGWLTRACQPFNNLIIVKNNPSEASTKWGFSADDIVTVFDTGMYGDPNETKKIYLMAAVLNREGGISKINKKEFWITDEDPFSTSEPNPWKSCGSIFSAGIYIWLKGKAGTISVVGKNLMWRGHGASESISLSVQLASNSDHHGSHADVKPIDVATAIPEPLSASTDYSFNSIIGGDYNTVRKSRRSTIIGGRSSVLREVERAVVGGLDNKLVGHGAANDKLPQGFTVFGKSNIISHKWREDYNSKNYINAYSAVMGSGDNPNFEALANAILGNDNRVRNCSKVAVLGSNNRLLFDQGSSSYSPQIGSEVTILGTDNEVKLSEQGLVTNLGIFGTNFSLTEVEMVQNTYYIGNPKIEENIMNLTRVFVAADGGAFFTGDVVAFALSDKKHKKNILTIDSAVDKLMQIRGITFEWKDTQAVHKGKDVGVLAQEVEKVLPEVVEERVTGKSVRYEKIVPLLIEAIKEQQGMIEDLRSRIDDLQ